MRDAWGGRAELRGLESSIVTGKRISLQNFSSENVKITKILIENYILLVPRTQFQT